MDSVTMKFVGLVSGKLRNYKFQHNKANFSCPLCGDSKHNSKKSRAWILEDKEGKPYFHCFNCGEGMSFKNFLKSQDDELYRQYVAEQFFNKGEYKPNKKVEDNSDKIKYEQFISLKNIISCTKMNNSSIYLRNRKLFEEKLGLFYHTNNYGELLKELKLEKYKDEFCFTEEKLVIPHFNRNNELAYIQFRSLDPRSKLRYKTYKVIEDEDKIWNLNNIDFNKKYIYITEGALDASFLDNAVAMSGSDISRDNNFMNNNKDKIRIIYDNEPRNPEIVKKYWKAIENGFSVYLWPKNIEPKDINDYYREGGNLDIFTKDVYYVKDMLGLLQLTDWMKVKI